MFYVYEYYDKDSNIVFYVGKGRNRRYKAISNRNEDFRNYYYNHNCDVRIIEYFENEDDAFKYEEELIEKYKKKGECFCNRVFGGLGGVASVWTDEKREYQSEHNPMKAKEQIDRMSKNNPMYKKEVREKQVPHKKLLFYGKYYSFYKELADEWGVCSATVAGSWKDSLDLIEKIIPNPVNPHGPFTYEEKCKIMRGLCEDTQRVKLRDRKKEGHATNNKKIVINDVLYDSILQASRTIGMKDNTIRARCKNPNYPNFYYYNQDNQHPSQ